MSVVQIVAVSRIGGLGSSFLFELISGYEILINQEFDQCIN